MKEKLGNLAITLLSVLLTSIATVFITISFAVPKISVNYGRVTKQVDIITENVNKLMIYNQNIESVMFDVKNLKAEYTELKNSYKEHDQLLGNVIVLARDAKRESERATQSNIDFMNKLETVNIKIESFSNLIGDKVSGLGTNLAVLTTDVKYIRKEIDTIKEIKKN